MQYTTRVLSLRLKDSHARVPEALARDVKFVWNYCNEPSVKVWEREQLFLSGYDFHPYTKGVGKVGLGLHSGTIQAVAEEHAMRRKQARKVSCTGTSQGARRSLGWTPF